VGSCRLGTDPAKIYPKPLRICYRPLSGSSVVSSGERQVVIAEGCDSAPGHKEDGWVCSEMEGNLEFWFSEKESVIRIDNGVEEESV
jgi:hypothetical protein